MGALEVAPPDHRPARLAGRMHWESRVEQHEIAASYGGDDELALLPGIKVRLKPSRGSLPRQTYHGR